MSPSRCDTSCHWSALSASHSHIFFSSRPLGTESLCLVSGCSFLERFYVSVFFCKFYNDHVDTRFTFTDELETSCGGVTEQKHFYIFTLGVFLGQIIYRSGMQMLYAQMVCSCAFSLQLIQSCRLWFILQLLCVFSCLSLLESDLPWLGGTSFLFYVGHRFIIWQCDVWWDVGL